MPAGAAEKDTPLVPEAIIAPDSTDKRGLIVPGLTLCANRCGRDAELVADAGERWAKPICFDCLEDLIERENAVEINRSAVEQIQRARTETRYRPPRFVPERIDDLDHSKLLELRRTWLLYRDRVAERDRCWAILPRGDRCLRRAAVDGYLCETHAELGGRMPGLGWKGEQACGNIIPIRRPA